LKILEFIYNSCEGKYGNTQAPDSVNMIRISDFHEMSFPEESKSSAKLETTGLEIFKKLYKNSCLSLLLIQRRFCKI